jgi:erythronate-4-phosphate dehydrogenase
LKIVADDKIPFLKGVLEPFTQVVYLPGSKISSADIVDADGLLIRTRTKCSESLLNGTRVKFIGTATIGFDHIDTAYCAQNNITWTNAPGCNSSSVQQYITAALLNLEHDNHINLCEKTIGVIGVGNVGSKIEKVARALGMNVLLNDPPRERREGSAGFVTFDTILKESDIITLHVPLNPQGGDKTWHLFNDNVFKKLHKRPWFINSSRGEVAETASLKRAIISETVSGAILDVWEKEPDIDLNLMEEAFIATPHIAGYSTDGKANGTSMVVNSLCHHFNLPLNDWYPGNVPEPENPVIHINCRGKKDEEIIREAVICTYDISFDDNNLRQGPDSFEKLRGDYRLRREFTAYRVRLNGGSPGVVKILSEIGFRIDKNN